MWAWIEIFLWIVSVSNSWNWCGTKSSIRMLLFTSPVAEAGVNFSDHQCESKSSSVKGASALIPFWTKCLYGTPIVNRNLELHWSVDSWCSWTRVSATYETLYTTWAYMGAAANVGPFTRSSACILLSSTTWCSIAKWRIWNTVSRSPTEDRKKCFGYNVPTQH